MLPRSPAISLPEIECSMGYIVSVRRAFGIAGVNDRGIASSVRNIQQIETSGAVLETEPKPEAQPTGFSAADLPWQFDAPKA
jgi:hypothetical protein